MKLEYTSYHFTILLILFMTLNAFNSAKAEYVMAITGGEVPAQEGITIEILINNPGDFTAFQVDIPIPEQFSYVEGSAVLNPDRITNHLLHTDIIDGNVLRFICFSITNASFLGNTGSVASFELSAGTQPGNYPLEPVNPIIANADQQNIITGAFPGTVTLLAPDIHLNTAYVNFGEIPLGEHEDRSVWVFNHGNQPLNVSEISFNSPWFSILGNDSFVVSPGSNQQVSIRFISEEQGHYQKTMTIFSNDPDTPEKQVALEAIAFAVNELHCGSMLSFSGTRDTLTLSINNMEEFVAFQFDLQLPEALTYVGGSVNLTPGRITDHIADANVIDGNILRVVAFSLSNQAFLGEDGEVISLAFDVFGTGGWCPLNLSNVIIADDEMNDILSAIYNGHLEVAAPDIFAQQQLNFGDVSVLNTSSELLTIHNWGSDTLFINQFQTTNDAFFLEEPTPVAILPGHSLDLEVFFHHPQKGDVEGVLQIFSNDPDENPYLVELSAYTFAPNYMIVPDVSAFMEDVIYVDVKVDNHESFVAFDFHLTFPEEVMTFLPAGEHSHLTDRAQDHLLEAAEIDEGVLRVFSFSMNNLEFLGNSGAVVRLGFAVDAPHLGMSYPLLLSEAILSDASMENLLYASIDGQLNVIDGEAFPDILTLDEHTVADDEDTCFDASETIITGGDGGWFWVQNGGSASLIAGQNIIMLPGTQIDTGGYMLARIAAHENDFCGIPKAIEYKHDDVITQIFTPDKCRNTGFFEVYPNPTEGYFTIELFSDHIKSDINVSIYNLQGRMLYQERRAATRIHGIDINSFPPGMYLLRVNDEKNADTVRLIKR